MGADPGEAFLLSSGWHTESFFTPDAAYTLVVDLMAFVAEMGSSTPPPPPWPGGGELPERFPDLRVVLCWDGWGEALG